MPFTPVRTEVLIKSCFFALHSVFFPTCHHFMRWGKKNKKVLFQLNGRRCSNLIIIINIYKCSVTPTLVSTLCIFGSIRPPPA